MKETNLIFAEHRKLLIENDLLYKQIENYKDKDSLKTTQINQYKTAINSYNDRIDSLNKKIKKKNKAVKSWKIGGISVSAGLLLFALFK